MNSWCMILNALDLNVPEQLTYSASPPYVNISETFKSLCIKSYVLQAIHVIPFQWISFETVIRPTRLTWLNLRFTVQWGRDGHISIRNNFEASILISIHIAYHCFLKCISLVVNISEKKAGPWTWKSLNFCRISLDCNWWLVELPEWLLLSYAGIFQILNDFLVLS